MTSVMDKCLLTLTSLICFVIIAYREVLSRPKFRFPIDLVDDLIDGICRRAISVTADNLEIDLPDPKDKVYYDFKGVIAMPNIKPVSDLRNYTEVLKEVDVTGRVYLTRNGHGEYGILTMAEIDELDRYRAAYTLFSKLQKAEERAEKEGWIDADDLEKELGVK